MHDGDRGVQRVGIRWGRRTVLLALKWSEAGARTDVRDGIRCRVRQGMNVVVVDGRARQWRKALRNGSTHSDAVSAEASYRH